MPKKVDTLKIPAYQRKRSLAAKARKKTTRRKLSAAPRKLNYSRLEETISDIEARELKPSEELFPRSRVSHKRDLREMKTCGTCTGYFEKIDVAIIKLNKAIRKGDTIIFEKEGGLFEQEIKSLQLNRKEISLARSGYEVGLKVAMKPTVGGLIYTVI